MAIEIDGLNELVELLQNETPRAAKRYLKKCAMPAVEVVMDALGETVPVKVGILEESFESKTSFTTADGGYVDMDVVIGPIKSVFWGSFAEFGTAKQPAQHWMGNAWAACKDKVLSVFSTELVGLCLDLENKRK